MPPSPQTTKLTSTLHLLIPRLRLLQKKDTASSVIQRRELASLLESHRVASARIRVENVIATDIAVEVMEIVELYCELLLARAGVLDQIAFGEKGVAVRARVRGEVSLDGRGNHGREEKAGTGFGWFFGGGGGKKKTSSQTLTSTATTAGTKPTQEAEAEGGAEVEHSAEAKEDEPELEEEYIDRALDEAAASIFYAWSRFPHDVRELTILRSLLTERYGKDFMALAQDNKLRGVRVPERLVKGLRVSPPSRELVESYLEEIARAYRVDWPHSSSQDNRDGQGREGSGGGDEAEEAVTGEGEGPASASASASASGREASEAELKLSRATPPRGLHAGGKTVSVAPPGPRVDNPSPRVRVPKPDGDGGDGGQDKVEEIPSPSQRTKTGGIPEVDELTRRFAALKR